jgi:hypothetical protein
MVLSQWLWFKRGIYYRDFIMVVIGLPLVIILCGWQLYDNYKYSVQREKFYHSICEKMTQKLGSSEDAEVCKKYNK